MSHTATLSEGRHAEPFFTKQLNPSALDKLKNLSVLKAELESGLLGGSWVVVSGVISPLVRVTIKVKLLITPLITTMNLQANLSNVVNISSASPPLLRAVAADIGICSFAAALKLASAPASSSSQP